MNNNNVFVFKLYFCDFDLFFGAKAYLYFFFLLIN